MYMTFASRNSTEAFLFKDLSVPRKALVLTFFVVSVFQSILLCYVDLFNTLAAVAIYDVTNRIDKAICSHTDKINIRFLLTTYEQMWTEMTKINAINSRLMLVVYVQTLTYLSSTCVDLMEESNWLNRVYVLSYYFLYALTFLLAAEANEKVTIKVKIHFLKFFSIENSIKKMLALKLVFRQTQLKKEFGSITKMKAREEKDGRKVRTLFRALSMELKILRLDFEEEATSL